MLPGETLKQKQLDLSPIFSDGGAAPDAPRFCSDPRNMPFDKAVLGHKMLAATRNAIEDKLGGTFEFDIYHHDRNIGAILSGEIARRYGNNGMEDAPIEIALRGTACESF